GLPAGSVVLPGAIPAAPTALQPRDRPVAVHGLRASAMTPVRERLRAGITTATAGETRAVAAELAASLPPDSTIALHGDLGVGKTTFVQGLAAGFSIREGITSPTYTIYTIHRGPRVTLIHLDAY